MKKILVVEDDKSVARNLCELLSLNGYEPITIDNFENIMDEIALKKANLILLDINIPCMNGQAVLQNIRKTSGVPVIMVTSKSSEIDEMLSMSFGADNYVTKPYNPNILLLRIAAVLKRVEGIEEIKYRGLDIDMKKGYIKNGEQEIVLTKNEMIIFNYLLTHQSKIVTRDELMTDLWNNQEYINDNALTVNISRLRAKLAEIGIEDAIETRKGIGYILK